MKTLDVAIIGGGFSGLSLGYQLLKNQVDNFAIFESSLAAGGYMGSTTEDGFVVEKGPNSLLDSEPSFKNMIADLQLETLHANLNAKNRFLFYKDKKQPIPLHPLKLLTSSLLSFSAKKEILTEPFDKYEVSMTPETIYEFFISHIGAEATDILVRAAVVGVYAGKAEALRVDRCFPQLVELEKTYGSLIKGMLKNKNSRGRLITFKNGSQTLVDKLVQTVGNRLLCSHKVIKVEESENGYRMTVKSSTDESTYLCKKVVFCTSWQSLNKILSLDHHCEPVSDFAPVVSLSLGFEKPVTVGGFGVIVHPSQRMETLGVLSPSEIFVNRAPENRGLLTLIMGGAFYPDLIHKSDADIVGIALKDLEKVLGPLPKVYRTWLYRYPEGITQYTLASVEKFDRWKDLISSLGYVIHSHCFGGVSISDISRKSYELAQELKASLKSTRTSI